MQPHHSLQRLSPHSRQQQCHPSILPSLLQISIRLRHSTAGTWHSSLHPCPDQKLSLILADAVWHAMIQSPCIPFNTHSCCSCSLLGCPEGRSAAKWVDYKLFGHQIVCHHVKGYNASATANAVDGDPVPVPHFGLALSVPQFKELAERVEKANVQFVIQPHLRFQGKFIQMRPL